MSQELVYNASTSRLEPDKPCASQPTTRRRTHTTTHEKDKTKCRRCGNTSHKPVYRNCPAKNAVCHLCSKESHCELQCKSQTRVHSPDAQEVPVRCKRSIFINDHIVPAMIDTSVEISVILRDVLILMLISFPTHATPSNIKAITVYGGSKLQVIREVDCILIVTKLRKCRQSVI